MSPDSTPLRVLQISDTHLFADPGGTLHGVNTRETLQRVLDTAARQPRPDLVLATGDLVHDQPAAYPVLAEMLRQLHAPVAAIAGNHDAAGELRAIQAAGLHVGGMQRLNGWRILLLNTQVPGKVGGHLSQPELTLLQDGLRTAGDAHVLIALHHHPVPLRSAWLDRIALDNPDEFFSILDCSANVRGVIWGHVHQEFDAVRRG
ncbi:MAG: metallophosphoesterase, partial [Gammaproteobacteria bacterium]